MKALLLILSLLFSVNEIIQIQLGQAWQRIEWVPVIAQVGTNPPFHTTIITNITIFRPVVMTTECGTNVCSEVLSNVTMSCWSSNIVWTP